MVNLFALCMSSALCTVNSGSVSSVYARLLGICMHIMLLTPSMCKVRNGEVQLRRVTSAYPVHGSASEVNHSDADVQVLSRHHYLVVFHLFVEQLINCLLYLWARYLACLYPPSLRPPLRRHYE